MLRAFIRHALLKNIDTRLETFKYTIYEPNSSTFAENGLYYQNNALICFSCGGGTALTDISENYESLHYTECQFNRELDVSIRIPNNCWYFKERYLGSPKAKCFERSIILFIDEKRI
jgi:hypothetical protein